MEGIVKIGYTVKKKSNRPFKSGLRQDIVVELGINPHCPKNSGAVKLKTCGTWVNKNRLLWNY